MLKFGVDYRRLSSTLAPKDYNLSVSANSLTSLETNVMDSVCVSGNRQATLNYDNVSLYAQDAFRVTPRLTVDMGLRWEINPPPSGRHHTGTGGRTARARPAGLADRWPWPAPQASPA